VLVESCPTLLSKRLARGLGRGYLATLVASLSRACSAAWYARPKPSGEPPTSSPRSAAGRCVSRAGIRTKAACTRKKLQMANVKLFAWPGDWASRWRRQDRSLWQWRSCKQLCAPSGHVPHTHWCSQSSSSQQAMPQKQLAGATSSSYRERRKEQVALPAQSTVSQAPRTKSHARPRVPVSAWHWSKPSPPRCTPRSLCTTTTQAQSCRSLYRREMDRLAQHRIQPKPWRWTRHDACA